MAVAIRTPGTARRAAPAPERHLADEVLVALVARRDERALASLYDRHGRVAFGLALRIVRDAELAEDAVQEAFLAVWREARRFRPERAGARAWILMLVHRRAVDVVRREDRGRRVSEPDPATALAAHSAEDETWTRLLREQVQRALRELPAAQREMLELAYYGGFTQSELATRLDQPLGTVKSRMFAGLTALRAALADDAAKSAVA